MSDMLKLCTQRNYFLTTPTMNTIFATNQGITCHLIYNEQWRQLFLKVTPENSLLCVRGSRSASPNIAHSCYAYIHLTCWHPL